MTNFRYGTSGKALPVFTFDQVSLSQRAATALGSLGLADLSDKSVIL